MLDNILNLADWVVYGVRESAEGYQFTWAYPAITLCPGGHAEDQLPRFGRKEPLFLDLPMHGKRVALLVDRRRYRCKVCGKTF
ncbi:MAG: transposase family protein [Ktedonobacterales bacterium]|nr:transposase family protein [Ktedonobacterales bacterium]